MYILCIPYVCVIYTNSSYFINHYLFKTVGFPFDKDLFPPDTFHLIKPSIGAFLDPVTIIAERLLSMSWENWTFEPVEQIDSRGVHNVGSFATGAVFKQICEKVHLEYGADVKVIVYDINYDAMALDISGEKVSKTFEISLEKCNG